MPVLPFGEWKPDVTDYMGQSSHVIKNVTPHADGYGPVLGASAYSSALPAACRGYFYARKNDGSIAIFAGTLNRLYLLNNSTSAWVDVSKGGVAYSDLSSSAQWQFVQFNKFVIAVQANAKPQVYDLVAGGVFADLGGTPPQAAYISIVNRFLVLSGIASPDVYNIQWSGLNATTTWTSGVNLSDFQTFADGGFVRGVAGGEFGYIFQDTAIRRMTFAPGSPYIFGIDRISADDGLLAPYSLIQSGDRVFFLSPNGFKMLVPGGFPQSIGKERVDRTVLADIDTSDIQLVIGAGDPTKTRVHWAYRPLSGAAGVFGKILIYDWVLDRWALIEQAGEYLASLGIPGITLEQVDTVYGANIDTLTIASFDNISTAAFARPSIFDSSNRMCYLNGPALEATLVTSEQGGDGTRIFVRGFRPVTDAPTVYGAVIARENLQATAVTGPEAIISARTGLVPLRKSSRFVRGKVRIPAGTTWTFAAGVEPDIVPDGTQ